jgi:hypothetical protein
MLSAESLRSAGRPSSRRQTPKSLNGGTSPTPNGIGQVSGEFSQEAFQEAQEKIISELLEYEEE